MATTYQIAEIAAHVGEPTRAAMLAVLMDGRALTAAELAEVAGITPQTASGHLARLTSARLLRVEKQGRHRYHRLATTEVARMLEGLMHLAASDARARGRTVIVGPRDTALRAARTCYDHLAGRLGVAIAEGLSSRGVIEFEDDAGLVTDEGLRFLRRAGIMAVDDAAGAPRSSRPLCRPCLDWSERRPHVAGKLGAAICRHAMEQSWVRRLKGTRALQITPRGRTQLPRVLGARLME